MSNDGSITLPLLEVDGFGARETELSFLGLSLNLALEATTQYSRYNFNSMCKFGDHYIAANEYGIFTLNGDDDDGRDINARFDLVKSNLGIQEDKRIRKFYVSGEGTGTLKITTIFDDNSSEIYYLDMQEGYVEHGTKISARRSGRGEFIQIRVENQDGADFSVDQLSALLVVVRRRTRDRR
jgi:hypothetical protein